MEQVARKRTVALLQNVFWLLVGFAFIAWFTVQAVQARSELEVMQEEVDQARLEVQSLERERRETILEIEGLQNDPFLIEQRLRKETGKARPGEVPSDAGAKPGPR